MKWIKLSCKLFIFGVISAFIILIGLYVYAYFAPALDIKNANQFLIYDDKEELIYQNNIYTFIKGEFVSKEEIKDENTLKKINDYLVFIKTQDEKVDKTNIFIKKVSTNETKKIEDVEKKEIKNIINQEIPDDNLNNIDN